jgi:hypothetical protein
MDHHLADKHQGKYQEGRGAQLDARPESETTAQPDQKPTFKSTFDDAAYRRWSEKLQSSKAAN